MDAAISSRLPALLQAGLFDSRIKFAGQRATVGRVMTQYELELYLEEGGAVFVQGKRWVISGAIWIRPALMRFTAR